MADANAVTGSVRIGDWIVTGDPRTGAWEAQFMSLHYKLVGKVGYLELYVDGRLEEMGDRYQAFIGAYNDADARQFAEQCSFLLLEHGTRSEKSNG